MGRGVRRRALSAALRAGDPPAAEAEAAGWLPPRAVGAAIYRQHLLAGRLGRAPPRLHEQAEPAVRRGTAQRAAGWEGPAFLRGGLDGRSRARPVETPFPCASYLKGNRLPGSGVGVLEAVPRQGNAAQPGPPPFRRLAGIPWWCSRACALGPGPRPRGRQGCAPRLRSGAPGYFAEWFFLVVSRWDLDVCAVLPVASRENETSKF